MRAVSAVEAKSKFGRLLDQVEHGEEVLITRRGRPVTRRVATVPSVDRKTARRAVAGIFETSKGMTLGGLKIKDLVNEGRP